MGVMLGSRGSWGQLRFLPSWALVCPCHQPSQPGVHQGEMALPLPYLPLLLASPPGCSSPLIGPPSSHLWWNLVFLPFRTSPSPGFVFATSSHLSAVSPSVCLPLRSHFLALSLTDPVS